MRVKGKITWRVNDNCVEVDVATWFSHQFQRIGVDWSALPSGRPLADASAAAIEVARDFLDQAASIGDQAAQNLRLASDADLIRRLNLVDGHDVLTNAGALLFVGTEHEGIDYVRRNVAAGDSTNRIRSTKPLIQQVYEVDHAIAAANRVVHSRDGLVRGQARAIPAGAVREAVVNAVVHRDWMSRSPVLVEHIGDMLTVTSPVGRQHMILEWARARGRVSSSEVSSLTGLSVVSAGKILADLESDGRLAAGRPTRTGRGFSYIPIADCSAATATNTSSAESPRHLNCHEQRCPRGYRSDTVTSCRWHCDLQTASTHHGEHALKARGFHAGTCDAGTCESGRASRAVRVGPCESGRASRAVRCRNVRVGPGASSSLAAISENGWARCHLRLNIRSGSRRRLVRRGREMTGTDDMADGNRHATNLELFLDLVFVFAVTQVTSFVAHDLTARGVAKGLLLAWLAWWQWTAFTWAGTAVDLEGDATRRVAVLCMIPAVLVMAITLPQALTTQATWFAGAYWLVQVSVLAIQGVDAWKLPSTRRAWAFYAPVAAVAPTLLLVGSFFDGLTRLSVWMVVGVLNAVSALMGGRSRAEWSIDPVHFAERHSLFVIISLGEVLVAIGATAAATAEGSGMDGPTLAAVIAAVGVACVLWWSYFAYVPRVVEHTLAHPGTSSRGQMARNLFSFGHFPIVCGVISYAVVAKHLVQNPKGHLATPDRMMLLGSVVLFVGGLLNLQFQVSRRVSWVRIAAIGFVAMVAVAGGSIPALAVVATTSVILGLMAVISARRFRQTDLGRALAGR